MRSQNYKWFTASLMWYFTDRMHAVMNGRECRVVESNAIGTEDTDGRKVITLRLQRPKTFLFSPGQYVFLSIKGGDRVVAVLYISPKKFIYFLKHPEDPDFRAFRLKIPSSATAKTTSL